MQAFSIDEWASEDAYTLGWPSSDRPMSPSAARNPAASRAAARAMSEDVDAVSVMNPSNSGGKPKPWRSQPTTTDSSSVPIGDVRHSIVFWLSDAISISPSTPAAEAGVANRAMNPGWAQCVAFGSMSVR